MAILLCLFVYNVILLYQTNESLFNKKQIMETNTNQNQIVITTISENEKQKLPFNLLLTLAAGTIAGMALIFVLFMGAEMLLGR
jgi:hypothetical protein